MLSNIAARLSPLSIALLISAAFLLTQFSPAMAAPSDEIWKKCTAYGEDVRMKCERDSCGGACTLEAHKRCLRMGANADNACITKSNDIFLSPGTDNRPKPKGPGQVRQPDSSNPKGPEKPLTPKKSQQQHMQSPSSSGGEPSLR